MMLRKRISIWAQPSLAVSRALAYLIQRRETASVLQIVLVLLAVLVGASARADTDWKLVEEDWYILEIDEQPAGWLHARLEEREELIRSSSKMNLAVDRAAVGMGVEIETTFVETRSGKPISINVRKVMSQQPVETRYVFEQDGIVESSRQGGREMIRTHPLPEGVWLTPYAAHRYFFERMKADASEIVYRTIDPSSSMKPIQVTRRRAGEDVYEVDGRELPVSVWRMMTDDTAPLEAIEHITSDGHLVYQNMPVGFGDLVMRRVSRDEALAADGAAAPDLFARTVVKSDRPIRNFLHARSIKLRLTVRTGELPELPTAGYQRVTMAEDRKSAILKIDMDKPGEATDEERENREFIEPSPLVDSDDALVQALARRALRSLDGAARGDPASRAEAIRRFVFEYLANKNLDTAFASASETARTRAGDCTEHAVLLAALLRAAEIPSRLASGLVYIDEFTGHRDVFGWHMWTQAMIEGKWIDLDPTLPVPHHAAHITTSVSSLADDSSSESGSMLMLVGNLDVEVLGAETAEQITTEAQRRREKP